MHVIVSAVHFDQLNVKISTYTGKVTAQLIDGVLIKYFSSIFGNKYQVNMHQKNAVSSPANIGFFCHRPKYNNSHETTSSL
ncbi:Uncharacterised protein [Serratia plymuthica]|nr:Uncharacterised protein [Serratia plymuthica]